MKPLMSPEKEADLQQLIAYISQSHSPMTKEEIEFGLAALGMHEKERSILAEKWLRDE
ncbi:MAG: hypothetical protein ACXAB4_09940 [Candidatus Hodarchaeales archaeon]|jgi:hypothetical protein